jgi:hypothetical protein
MKFFTGISMMRTGNHCQLHWTNLLFPSQQGKPLAKLEGIEENYWQSDWAEVNSQLQAWRQLNLDPLRQHPSYPYEAHSR